MSQTSSRAGKRRNDRLYEILQAFTFWQDYHLYEFRANGVCYGVHEPEFLDEEPVLDARKTRLLDIAPNVGATFTYLYDFGDDWLHDVVVRGIDRPDPCRTYPLCIGGERASPPEDCGGVHGYVDLLACPTEGRGEEYDELLLWLGGDFDRAAFDRNLANRRLHTLR